MFFIRVYYTDFIMLLFIHNFIKQFFNKICLVFVIKLLFGFHKSKLNAKTNNYGFIDRLSTYIFIYSINKLFAGL